MPAKPLTPEQKGDADRLLAAWTRFKQQHPGYGQAQLALACGWKTQGTVSQYLHGRIPLNLDALLKFSGIFGVDPATISPTLAQKLPVIALSDQPEDGLVRIPVLPSKYKYPPVVGKGAGGYMPEKVWTDADHPVGDSDEFAEVISSDPQAFVTEVIGPSMIPRYNPGEYALVEPNTQVDLGDDVLVRLSSGATLLKRLLSRRSGIQLGSYNDAQILHFKMEEITWVYYVAYPVPAKKIKTRI